MTDLNIYQRINEVRKAIGYVQKDKDVGFGKSSYRAVTHDAVTGMVREALIKQGVVIVPSVISSEFHPAEMVAAMSDKGEIVTTSAKQRLYEAEYQIDFVNIDKPEDKVTMRQCAHALDNGDKAPGKAMSYATKYAILKMFNIETGEDEESRYQVEEFDTVGKVDLILACKSLPELQKTYGAFYKEAEAMRDKDAMKAMIAAKDKAKAAIANDLAGQA